MEKKYYEEVRKLKWPEGGPTCPYCNSENIDIFESTPLRYFKYMRSCKKYTCPLHCDKCSLECQKYHCNDCNKYFDDLTGTIFKKNKFPITIWIYCMYYKSKNYSNSQIAEVLAIAQDDVEDIFRNLTNGIIEDCIVVNHLRRSSCRRGFFYD